MVSLLFQRCEQNEPVLTECNFGEELPDLVIIDIKVSTDPGHFITVFKNNGGVGNEEERFLISYSCENGNYLGNSNYPIEIPRQGEIGETGDIDYSVLNLSPGEPMQIKAIIDWEKNILEADECNNEITIEVDF